MQGLKKWLSGKWDASAGPFFDDKTSHPLTSMIAQDLFYKGDVSKKQIDDAYDKLTLQGEEEKAVKLKQAYLDGKYDGKFNTKTAITNLTLTAAFAPVVVPGYFIKKAIKLAWNGNESPPNTAEGETGDNTVETTNTESSTPETENQGIETPDENEVHETPRASVPSSAPGGP